MSRQLRAQQAGGTIISVSPNSPVRRCVSAGDHVLLETNGAGTKERMYSYYPGVDQPHSVRVFGGSVAGRYYYTMELPGHVSGLVNASGALVNQYRYSAFGRAELTQEGVPNSLRFMAREWDADAGAVLRAQPVVRSGGGSVRERGPDRDRGGINLYAYAHNDPMGLLRFGLVPGSSPPSTPVVAPMRSSAFRVFMGSLILVGCADFQRSEELATSAEAARASLAQELGVSPALSWSYANGRITSLEYSFPVAVVEGLSVGEFYRLVASHVEAEFEEVPPALSVSVTAEAWNAVEPTQ